MEIGKSDGGPLLERCVAVPSERLPRSRVGLQDEAHHAEELQVTPLRLPLQRGPAGSVERLLVADDEAEEQPEEGVVMLRPPQVAVWLRVR